MLPPVRGNGYIWGLNHCIYADYAAHVTPPFGAPLIYRAIFNQHGTSDPLVNVVESDPSLSGIVWARTGVGTYTLSLPVSFSELGTFVLCTRNQNNPTYILTAGYIDTSTIGITQYDTLTAANIDEVFASYIELLIYPPPV